MSSLNWEGGGDLPPLGGCKNIIDLDWSVSWQNAMDKTNKTFFGIFLVGQPVTRLIVSEINVLVILFN